MTSQVQERVRVLTEDEFWSEIRQFKIRQLMHWHEELRMRRFRTDGLAVVEEEYQERMRQIQAIQEQELAELVTEQLIDNTQRIDNLEQRLLGIIVWMLILLGLQVVLLVKLGGQIF